MTQISQKFYEQIKIYILKTIDLEKNINICMYVEGTNYNMTVWILAGNYISFTIAAGLIRLHMPGVKKYRG